MLTVEDPDQQPDPDDRISMFLGLPDPHPDPLATSTDPAPDPSIVNHDFYCFVTYLRLFLIFKNDPHVFGLQDPHPDPLVRGTLKPHKCPKLPFSVCFFLTWSA